MADIDKILRLVADGVLTPEEADEILSATTEQPTPEPPPVQPSEAGPRHLRIEVHDAGKSVVNLRVPMNIAGWASAFLPGLSDESAERIRGVASSGERGPILDVTSEDGSRVLIVSE